MSSIAVIIPTHNRIDRLTDALDSVLAQTLPPDEVIVVDDGSNDGTADRLLTEYSSVRVLRQDQAGVSAARNLGIQTSASEWIAFLDSDDTWMPRKLARQIEALEREPEYPLCHTGEIWIRNGCRVNPMKKHAKAGGWIFRNCLPLCVISPSSAMIRRKLLMDLGGFDPSLPACEDYDLWLRICSRHPVLFLPEPLITKVGGHEDQLSRKHWGMDRFRVRALEKLLGDASLQLSKEDRKAAAETLIAKLEVLENGARKRGKAEAAMDYRQRRGRADALLSGSGLP